MTLLTVVSFFPSQSKRPFQFPNSLSAFQLFSSLNLPPGIKRLEVSETWKSQWLVCRSSSLFTARSDLSNRKDCSAVPELSFLCPR